MSQELGRRIRAARAYGGLIQEEVAESLNVDRRTLATWEQGRVDVPEIRQRHVIETVAGLTGLPETFFTAPLDGTDWAEPVGAYFHQ